MRFVKSNRRLVLYISDRQVESIVLAAVQCIVPRYTRKLYFLGQIERAYPAFEKLTKQRDDFTIVRDNSEPSNLINTFRIVHRENELFIVAGGNSRLAPADWESVIAKLEKAA